LAVDRTTPRGSAQAPSDVCHSTLSTHDGRRRNGRRRRPELSERPSTCGARRTGKADATLRLHPELSFHGLSVREIVTAIVKARVSLHYTQPSLKPAFFSVWPFLCRMLIALSVSRSACSTGTRRESRAEPGATAPGSGTRDRDRGADRHPHPVPSSRHVRLYGMTDKAREPRPRTHTTHLTVTRGPAPLCAVAVRVRRGGARCATCCATGPRAPCTLYPGFVD
jgi:hypothetical protein